MAFDKKNLKIVEPDSPVDRAWEKWRGQKGGRAYQNLDWLADIPIMNDRIVTGEPDMTRVERHLLKWWRKIWLRYTDRSNTLTLGQLLELEPSGQGKKPAIPALQTRDRDVRIALEYEKLCERGHTRTEAIGQLASRFGVSEETVKNILSPPKRRKRKPG